MRAADHPGLVSAGKIVQIKILNHVIGRENRYFSLVDCGLIAQCKADLPSLKGERKA